MWYNLYCLNEQNYRGLLFSPHNLSIAGKLPSVCGLESSAVRLGNDSTHGGHFAMTTKNCIICGEEFIPHNGRQLTCSNECSITHRRVLNLRNKHKNYKYKPKPKTSKNCIICGKEFIPKHGCTKTCSEECKRKQVKKYGEKYLKHFDPINCPYCGVEFIPKLPHQKCCCEKHGRLYQGKVYRSSEEGKEKQKKERNIRTQKEREKRGYKVCGICGKQFLNSKKYPKYCSDECKEKAAALQYERDKEYTKEYARVNYKPPVPTKRNCKWCNAEFDATGKKGYCCEDHMYMAMWGHPKPKDIFKVCKICYKEFVTKKPGKICCSRSCSIMLRKSRKADEHQRRKTKERKAFVKRVVRLDIFERDNWICQICNKKVDHKLKFPHPMSATIDHIVPIANGGTHEPRNCQLAHFVCNSKKSNTQPDQIRMFEWI